MLRGTLQVYDQSQKVRLKSIRAWISKFWFVRGAVAAASLTGFVPSIVDLSRFEFLRVFHVAFVFWERILADLGRLLHFLLGVTISGADIGATLILVNILIPSGISIFKIAAEADNVVSLDAFLKYCFLLFLMWTWPFMSYFSLSLPYVKSNPFLQVPGLLSVCASFVAMLVVAIIVALPRMRSGFLFVIGFVVACEGLYWISAPWIGDGINQYICNLANIPLSDCVD